MSTPTNTPDKPIKIFNLNKISPISLSPQSIGSSSTSSSNTSTSNGSNGRRITKKEICEAMLASSPGKYRKYKLLAISVDGLMRIKNGESSMDHEYNNRPISVKKDKKSSSDINLNSVRDERSESPQSNNSFQSQSGGSLKVKYDDMKKELEQLKADYNILKREYQYSEKAYDGVFAMKAELTLKNKQLTEENEQLKKELDKKGRNLSMSSYTSINSGSNSENNLSVPRTLAVPNSPTKKTARVPASHIN